MSFNDIIKDSDVIGTNTLYMFKMIQNINISLTS